MPVKDIYFKENIKWRKMLQVAQKKAYIFAIYCYINYYQDTYDKTMWIFYPMVSFFFLNEV